MSIRESYVEHFGEEEARKIEAAANGHRNGVHDNPGSDPFKWAIVICIGHECFTRRDFREYHDIKADANAIKQWIQTHGQLDSHDGDSDFLALFCGVYNEYMPVGGVQ